MEVVGLPPTAVLLEPQRHVLVFVIGGVVLDEDNRLRIVATCHLLEEIKIGLGIEDGVTMIGEPCGVELHAAEYLDALALPRYRYLGLPSPPGPGAVQG